MNEVFFWLAVFLSVYSYFLYPVLLILIKKLGFFSASTEKNKAAGLPLSLIITVHNESARIREKIENSLLIEYGDDLEIIIASDHSTDDTEEIVREYADRGVKLVRADKRLGKEYAQWCAIREAAGQVLVFSDVATRIPVDALQNLVSYFSDKSVGAVSSEDRFMSKDGSVAGEGAYVQYEMWLRKMESSLAGLVGLSGSFFAARKSVCQQWDIESPSDFNTALNCASLKLKAVTAPNVLGFYEDLKDSKQEYQRKVRTALRGMTALLRHPQALNPLTYGMFAVQVWSHKVMRWLVPWFLVMAFITNLAVLSEGLIYQLGLLAQLGFYGVALGAHFSNTIRGFAPAKIIYFFVQVNIALAESFIRLASGRRMTVWQPSAR